MRKNKDTIQGSAKGTLPLEARLTADKVVTTVTNQLASVEACSDYVNQPSIQTASAALKGSLGTLVGVLTNLSTARTLVTTLEGERDAQCLVVRRDHDALKTSVNKASQGQPGSLLAWGAKLVTRSILDPSTDAPLDVRGKALGAGLVRAQCKQDLAAFCYLFQVGTDPSDLDAWPSPRISTGCRFTFEGTAGEKLYFRVAIHRRRSGQGRWSDIVEITVH